jgi:hypothetical protein
MNTHTRTDATQLAAESLASPSGGGVLRSLHVYIF